MLLDVRNLTKSFGQTRLLQDISVSVERGQVVVILGVSGSGKSTFLKCLNALEEHELGYVRLQGQYVGYEPNGAGKRVRQSESRLNRLRTRMGMVFQSYNLFPHLNVLDNLTLAPIFIKGESRSSAKETAEALLARLGLSAKKHEYPSLLSGGEQQRVAIARALAMKPEIILLDEVTSALDPLLIGEVLDFIRGLASEGMTMIVVTHHLDFAMDVSDRIIFLSAGRIEADGPPRDIIEQPPTEDIARFVGRLRRQSN